MRIENITPPFEHRDYIITNGKRNLVKTYEDAPIHHNLASNVNANVSLPQRSDAYDLGIGITYSSIGKIEYHVHNTFIDYTV